MTKLIWDDRPYEIGLDRAVYYVPGGYGTAWNGLSDVKESPSEVDSLTQQVDGVTVRRREKPGDFAGTLEAFTVPDSFFEDVYFAKRRKNFGLSYRVQTESSYKIHLIYNILLAPSEQTHSQSEVDPFSWDFTTRPIPIPGAKNAAHLVIDASSAYPSAVEAIEAVLYGDESADARMPSPMEIADIFEVHSVLRITDNGDGTWTATGPDEAIAMLDADTFQITWPSIEHIDADTYIIRSW